MVPPICLSSFNNRSLCHGRGRPLEQALSLWSAHPFLRWDLRPLTSLQEADDLRCCCEQQCRRNCPRRICVHLVHFFSQYDGSVNFNWLTFQRPIQCDQMLWVKSCPNVSKSCLKISTMAVFTLIDFFKIAQT